MKLLEQIERINLIHEMIQRESTGTSDIFSSILHISQRQLFNIIEELRIMGAPILYDKFRKTYYYEYDFEIELVFKLRPIKNSEINEINGGFLTDCNFISVTALNFVLQ